jgi:hypothetical protein
MATLEDIIRQRIGHRWNGVEWETPYQVLTRRVKALETANNELQKRYNDLETQFNHHKSLSRHPRPVVPKPEED